MSWLPYYHDMGLFTAFLIPLSVGASVISIDPFEWVRHPELVLELIQRFRGTHCWMPNFAFHHLINTVPENQSYNLGSLRAIVSCSEPVKELSFERFLTRFEDSGVTRSKLKACYAMAETCFAITQSAMCSDVETRWYDVDSLNRHSLAVRRTPGSAGARPYVSNGSAIEGIDIRIFPNSTNLQPGPSVGVPVGEIGLRGGFVFKRFFSNKDATAAAFSKDWFRSGDVGFIDEGHLFICGRKKDILVVHGCNYYAHDIEAIVSDVPDIIPGRTVAIGVFDEKVGSEEAVLLAETDVGEEMYPGLRRRVKRRVEAALELTPQRVHFIPRGWLVKTTSGKVSRSENYKRYLTWTKNGEPKYER